MKRRKNNRHIPIDALDLGHVLVAVDQRGLVVELLLLARVQHLQRLGGVGLPQPDVGVVAARQHEPRVGAVRHREDALHALGVVDLAAVPVRVLPQPDGAIVRAGGEFLARWCVVNVQAARAPVSSSFARTSILCVWRMCKASICIHIKANALLNKICSRACTDAGYVREMNIHSGDVVLVDVEGGLEAAHVKRVAVVVLRGGGEVKRFHRVPADGVRSHLCAHCEHAGQ